jgi:hypothetical protein
MAHQEGLRIGNSSALTAHTGTAGTSEMVRVVATDAGALTVDLVSGDTIKVTVGTINAGTIDTMKAGTVDVLKAGTITKLEGGTVSVNKLWASSLGTIVIPTSDTVQSGTLNNTFEGYLRGFSMVTPAMTGTGTATLTLTDSLGGTMISQAQNESVTAYYGTIAPMTTGMKWIVTANGTQDANATVTIAVHYEK